MILLSTVGPRKPPLEGDGEGEDTSGGGEGDGVDTVRTQQCCKLHPMLPTHQSNPLRQHEPSVPQAKHGPPFLPHSK